MEPTTASGNSTAATLTRFNRVRCGSSIWLRCSQYLSARRRFDCFGSMYESGSQAIDCVMSVLWCHSARLPDVVGRSERV